MKDIIKKKLLNNSKEECGIIYFDKRVKIKECKNKAKNSLVNFEIPIEAYVSIKKKFEVFGIYHSHIETDEAFSKIDISHSEELMLPYFVYSFLTNKSNLYIPKSLNENKISKSFCNFLKRMRKEYSV